MAGRIFYPSVFNPPPAAPAAPSNTAFGGEVVAPAAIRRPQPQQPPAVVSIPGAFTTTNTQFGGAATAPETTRRTTPQQPDGLTHAPGAFTTTNTAFGGDVTAPATTRRLVPRQPDGAVLPPSDFGANPPNTTYGGAAFAPETTRQLRPQQPPGLTLPPGAFTTTNTALGGDVYAPFGTRRLTPQQPPGEVPARFAPPVVVPGGWECVAPATTPPSAKRQQEWAFAPAFPVPVLPNTTYGGYAVYPDRTRRLAPQQPPGYNQAPGVTTPPTRGPVLNPVWAAEAGALGWAVEIGGQGWVASG